MKTKNVWQRKRRAAWAALFLELSYFWLPLPSTGQVWAAPLVAETSLEQPGGLPILPSETVPSTSLPAGTSAEARWPRLEEIGHRAYLVGDLDSGQVLLESNADMEAYPASMTKIMTALCVLESPLYRAELPVHFSAEAVQMPALESATADFVAGEICPTLPCLYAMMVKSANEVANALAETYGNGKRADFIALMNQKAQEIGMTYTNFVDPCGFGGPEHHTTARDMFLLCQRAMKNPTFRALVARKSYSLPATNLHPMGGWSNLTSGNLLTLYGDSGLASPYIKSFDGIKTGTTDVAGYCLASAATTYDNRRLFAVIFDGFYLGEGETPYGVAALSRTLLEEGAKKLGAQVGRPSESEQEMPLLPGGQGEGVAAKAKYEAEGDEALARAKDSLPSTEEKNDGRISVKGWLLWLMAAGNLLALVFLVLRWQAARARQREQRQRRLLRELGADGKNKRRRLR